MTEKRRVRAKDVVSDIRAGLTNLQLREKYRLSSQGLESIFVKLVEAKAVRESELDYRVQVADDGVGLDTQREITRNYVFVRLPVYGAENLTVEGQVRDITEKGLQVAGLSVIVGDCKTLVLQADDFADIHPFVLEAQCRWVRRQTDRQETSAGFEIVDFSEGSLQELRKLIQALTLRG